jgi:hypothetical protein
MILGLDISSTKTGVCVLDYDGNLKYINYILTKTTTKAEKEKFQDIYDKTKYILFQLEELFTMFPGITRICIEEPLSKFAPGKSQIHTLKVLFEINYAISYELYRLYNIKPIHINPMTARSVNKIKIKKGEDAKNIVFDFVKSKYKEFDKICGDYSKTNAWVDAADSAVIALSALAL